MVVRQRRRDSCGLCVVFFFFFLPPSASQKKRRRAGISFENISSPAFLPSSSLHLLAPLLLALFLLSHRRSLFMLWTANQWAELFRGLNYVVILGFCLLCPSFFALTSSGILSWQETAHCRRGRKGKEARRGRKVRKRRKRVKQNMSEDTRS